MRFLDEFDAYVAQHGKTKELAIAYSAGLAALLFTGAGTLSVDRLLFGKESGSGQ